MPSIAAIIEAANAEVLMRILSADPVLVDVVPAHSVLPRLGARTILHAGPPVSWDRMCGPMRGAVMGIAVFEGWANDLAEAEVMAADGEFQFESNHDHGCVGPMLSLIHI